jgi:mannosyltransferase OCH1-like enzyme
LYAFDKLKPGAYKADLWRYCILYKKGGIYLDIKYRCVNGFKLIELTNKEYCVRDRYFEGIQGIYNALLCFKPNNLMLDKCIKTIVHYYLLSSILTVYVF